MIDPVFIAKCLCKRMAKAEQILSTPTLFKVCEGCGGIAKVDQFVCPSCHAYRFDTSHARLKEVCQNLSEQPFSTLHSAVAPRFPGLIEPEPPTPIQIHE